MKPPIGFVLITHNNPEQALFLCRRLTAQFDSPPIAVHNDFGKNPMDTSVFPPNVWFVEDWTATKWGGYGIVDGAMRALRLLYQKSDPDWYVLLSGADYPIKSAKAILDDLNSHDFDVYIDNRRIQYCMLPMPAGGWGDQNYIHPAWVRLAFERYMAIGFGFHKLATKLKWKRKALFLRSDFFIKRFTPFDGTVNCYAGDFWLTANRAAANAILADTPTNRKLTAHFSKRAVPDEGYYQSLFCNVASLKVCTDNKRYTDWRGCNNHPRTLTEDDFPEMLASTDHFARKFDYEPEMLQKLDRLVDGVD